MGLWAASESLLSGESEDDGKDVGSPTTQGSKHVGEAAFKAN